LIVEVVEILNLTSNPNLIQTMLLLGRGLSRVKVGLRL
jgi:hypothetical protein